MFKGLTQSARKILTVTARHEAKRMNCDQLQTEHIVMALLKESRSTACMVLTTLNVDADELYGLLEKNIVRKSSASVPVSTKILESSAEEARRMGHEYIGTGHLLLACLQETQSPLIEWLRKKDITLEALRHIINASQERKANIHKYSKGPSIISEKKDTPPKESKRSTPVLDEFSADLTQQATIQNLDPVIGRTKELGRVIQVLARRKKNNPILVGDPGVGKTAIIEGLAQRIVSNDTPEMLLDKRVVSLDLPGMVAGTKYRGEFEERMKRLMKEILSDTNIILFVDEIHTLIGAGGAEGSIDAANMVKPALARGDLQCVGATTLNEYKKYIERDSALERRFQPIFIEEPSVAETVAILEGIKKRYEDYHNVVYTKEALLVATEYSKRFIIERYLPDKAIDILDEAGAQKRTVITEPPAEIAVLNQEIQALNKKKQLLVSAQKYEEAAAIRDQLTQLRTDLDGHKNKWRKNLRSNKDQVDADDVLRVISDITNIPLTNMPHNEKNHLNQIEEYLTNKVIGQQDAIKVVSAAIRRARVGLSSPSHPVGSFIFLGPTGVGKTLLAKAIAEFLFGSLESVIRIDMSDYMEKHTISRLVGAPPGYVGYDEGGVLTEKIRRKPYSVVLLDEIEKAHADVFNILLQIMEEGELQDNLGHKVSFRNTLFIMTSNLGTHEALSQNRVGFRQQEHSTYQSNTWVQEELRKKFRPEFLNRIDATMVFKPLGTKELSTIFNILLLETKERLAKKQITLNLSQKVANFLVTKGTDTMYGARPLRRTIQKYIEDPISLRMVEESIPPGSTLTAVLRDDTIAFNAKKPSKKPPKAPPKTPPDLVATTDTQSK